MADEIEIRNVGGRDGVASEATMQLLLTEFRARASSDSQYQKAAQRAQESYNRSQNAGTKQQGFWTKATVGAAKAAGRFASEAAMGGDRLGDFAEAIFGANSRLTRFVRFGDDTIDTLRGLTSVGASFNNNIFDMIGASANSAMNLDDFSAMVQNNSTTLATFGSTVTAGARNLGQFSKEFRSGIGNQFFAMGFTIGDVNEGLISFLDLERRRSLAGLRTDRASQQAAADYIVQLDQLTKLTGEEREQIADRLKQQMQDAGIRAQVNRLEGTARTNFQNSLAFIESQLSGPLADGLKDLMDGVAQTDLGKALQSQIPGIGEFAQQMFRGGKSVDEVIDAMTNRFGPQLQSLSGQFSKAQLDQMRMSGGVTGAIAEILDSSYQINQLVGREAEEAREEQRRRERITATLGGFENAIINIRKFFVDAFLDAANRTDGLASAFKTLFATVGRLFGDGDGSLGSLGPTVTKYFNEWFGPGGTVTNGVNSFSSLLETTDWEKLGADINQTFTSFTNWLSEVYETYKSEGFGAALETAGRDILNKISNVFLGERGANEFGEEGRGERQGGLIKKMYDGIIGILDSTGATEFMTRVYDTIYSFLFEKDANGNSKMQTFLTTAYDTIYEFLFSDTGGASKMGAFLTAAYDKIYEFLFSDTNGQTKMGAFLTSIYDSVVDFLFPETQQPGPTLIDKVNAKLNELLFPNVSSDTSFIDNVKARLNAMIFGSYTGNPADGATRQGGILDKLGAALAEGIDRLFGRQDVIQSIKDAVKNSFAAVIDGISNFWNDPANKVRIDKFFEDMTGMFERLFETIQNAAIKATAPTQSDLESGNFTTSGTASAISGDNTVGNALVNAITGFGTIDRDQFLKEAEGGVYQRLNSAFSSLIGMGIDDWFDDKITDAVAGGMTKDEAKKAIEKGLEEYIKTNYSGDELDTMNRYFNESLLPVLQSRSLGTLGATGYKFEPEDTVAKLHKGERVLNPQEASEYNRNSNQTIPNEKLDQLNNTMMQVVALLAQGNQISERTAKGLRGMTNDYYRGMA